MSAAVAQILWYVLQIYEFGELVKIGTPRPSWIGCDTRYRFTSEWITGIHTKEVQRNKNPAANLNHSSAYKSSAVVSTVHFFFDPSVSKFLLVSNEYFSLVSFPKNWRKKDLFQTQRYHRIRESQIEGCEPQGGRKKSFDEVVLSVPRSWAISIERKNWGSVQKNLVMYIIMSMLVTNIESVIFPWVSHWTGPFSWVYEGFFVNHSLL